MIKRVELTEIGFRRNYDCMRERLFKFISNIEKEMTHTEEFFRDSYLDLSSIERLKLDYNLKFDDLKRKFIQFKYLEFDLKRNKFTPNTKMSLNFSKSFGKLELHQNYMNILESVIQNVIVCDFNQAKVDLLNLNTNYTIRSLIGHTNGVKCLCMYDSDGNKLITGSLDLTIKVWDLDSGECLKTIYSQAEILCLKVLANGLLATGGHDSSIQIWNLQTGKCVNIFKGSKYIFFTSGI